MSGSRGVVSLAKRSQKQFVVEKMQGNREHSAVLFRYMDAVCSIRLYFSGERATIPCDPLHVA
jgi:hypothetical protein